MGYDALVSRKLTSESGLIWQETSPHLGEWGITWNKTGHHGHWANSTWQQGIACHVSLEITSTPLCPLDLISRASWVQGHGLTEITPVSFTNLRSQPQALPVYWEAGQPKDHSLISRFRRLKSLPAQHVLTWQISTQESLRWSLPFSVAKPASSHWRLPWEQGKRPANDGSRLPISPPTPPIPSPPSRPNLDFLCRVASTRSSIPLDFGPHPCSGGAFAVPILRVYFVTHHVEVVRLPDREPIPVKDLQIEIDADSWSWGFSATLPYSAWEMVEPTAAGPVEIEITVNKVVWRMLVEQFDGYREFGQSRLSIRGRSLVAYLAEPYAPTRSFVANDPFTAQQLAEQELNRAGLVTGFHLDWQLPDWLVPADSWGYESLTPIGVINRIVATVGGYLNAHAYRKTLIAKPRYPALPWEWPSHIPDRTIPIEVIKTLSLRWQEKPRFDAVYVAGEHQGVIGRVVRANSAGERYAPMVVDSLITHADAARERGRTILADTGKQALLTLELPMLPTIGLLEPGCLLQVGEGQVNWQGLVRSTRIVAAWSESLTVRQTLEVERHYLN